MRSADAGEIAATQGHTPDHERFRRLLMASVMRASESHTGILVAAKPGWSYDGGHTMSPGTRRLMDSVGFVVTDRHA